MDSKELVAARQRLLQESAADRGLHMNVVFTTGLGTAAALQLAARLAQGLDASFSIYAPLVVPHRIPLDQPPVDPDHVRSQILAALSGFAAEKDVRVEICLCRDRRDCLERLLAPGSLVFLGGPPSWRARRERRLAKALRTLGHEVVFVKQSGGRDA